MEIGAGRQEVNSFFFKGIAIARSFELVKDFHMAKSYEPFPGCHRIVHLHFETKPERNEIR